MHNLALSFIATDTPIRDMSKQIKAGCQGVILSGLNSVMILLFEVTFMPILITHTLVGQMLIQPHTCDSCNVKYCCYACTSVVPI